MKSSFSAVLLSLLPSVLIADPGTIKVPGDSAVVATIGKNEVNLGEVKEAFTKLDLRDQANASRDPATLNQIVRLLMVQRLMLTEADKVGWREKPEVKHLVERATQTAVAESFLQNAAAPPPEYPSDSELQQAYEAVKSSISSPRQWELAQIYIAVPESVTKENLAAATAKLETVKKALAEKDADFGKIAAEFSDDQVSKKQQGVIGWMNEDGIIPEIRTEATLLKLEEVSKPIRIKDGWHILKCVGKRDPFTPALADVKDSLKQRMRDEKAKANSQAYVTKLLQENPLSINEVALKQALSGKADK